jgi:molybdate transport system ATP-binding protein
MNLSVRIRKRLSSRFQVDVALEVTPGVAIVFGESGSGKTTLLRCVAGFSRPDEGRILAGGRVLFDAAARVDLPPQKRRLGFVFQQLALFPHMTVTDNIGYGLSQLPSAERLERTARIAESFRISHLLGRRPGAISGGEQQRVGLARALVTNPDVLMLDEPLSALDHTAQSRIIADLRQWNEARGIPILYVTHSQREVFALGERVVVMQSGSVIADGTPQQVMDMPLHEGVAQLAGFENLLDAVVVTHRVEAGVMVARLTGTTVELETPLAGIGIGRPVRVAVRAGDILIATEHPRGLSARNVLPGTIASLASEGAVARAQVDIGGTLLSVHVTPTSAAELRLTPGMAIWLVVKTHSCHPISAI